MSADETHQANPAVRFALNYWAPIVLVALSAVFIGQNRDRQQVHPVPTKASRLLC